MSEFEEKAVVKKSEDTAQDVNLVEVITSGGNPRGIPSAVFIENVEDFLQGHSIESMLGALNELYSKYKYMETSFEKSKGVYKSKIPEIEQTLEIIDIMMKKRDDGEDMITHYPLCDTLYSEAKVDTSDSKICLWVGASTMVEYSYEEGEVYDLACVCDINTFMLSGGNYLNLVLLSVFRLRKGIVRSPD